VRRHGLFPVVFAAAVWAYVPSFDGVFVFDDLSGIARNPHVRSLSPLSEAMKAPADTTLAGRPVASLTFALNYAAAPADARDTFSRGLDEPAGAESKLWRNAEGYHAVNFVIHVLAALALFGVVRRTVEAARPGVDVQRGAKLIAAAVAGLWVVHPLTTSAVTYIVQRVESLMALLYLTTLYCAIRAYEKAQGRWWAVAAVVSCALGMGTKETMVSAPIAVAIWYWIFAPRPEPRASSRARAWLYGGLAATWIILAALVATTPRGQSVGWTIAGWTPWTYLVTQAGVLLHYLRLVFYPSPLVLDYGWPPATFAEAAVPLLVVLAAFVATVLLVWRRHGLGFPAALFFLVLAPSSSLLPIASEVAAEHRMYLPLAAVLALVIAGVSRLLQRPSPGKWEAPLSQVGLLIAVGVVVVAAGAILGAETRKRNRDYSSQERLWQKDIAARPSNARSRTSYGMALFAVGRYPEAETQLRAAVELDPREAAALVNLGSVLCAQGRLDPCITELDRALAIDPGNADALAALGDAHTVRGDDARAAPLLSRALAVRPNDVTRLNRLGWLLAVSRDDRVRDGTRALELAERAVTMTGRRDVMSLNTLAAALAETGRFADAVTTMSEAIAVAKAQGFAAAMPELERRRGLFAAGRKYGGS
jgi:tetratricopeptide (TPR) repeat protein